MINKKHENNIKKIFFNEDLDIHAKLLNIILFGTIISSFASLIISLVRHFNFYSTLFVGIILILAVITLILLNIFKSAKIIAIVISLLTNNLVFPALFFCSGGIASGAPIWFCFSLIFPLLLIDGIISYVIFGINCIGFISSLIVSVKFPDWVTPMNSQIDIIFDIGWGVIFVVLAFGLIFKFQARIYKKQQDETFDAMIKAQKATKAKTAFLSNVTHDIRTPMNAIIGYTEIAKRNSDNRSKLFDCLSKISISSDHLLRLVNDVLEMSRIESGKLMLQYEAESINEIVYQISSIINTEIQDKNINYQIDLSEVSDDTIICDSLRVKQILLNLLSNAIKYSKQDGNVYFTVIQQKSEIQDLVKYEFHVKDEGCGMSEEFKTRIYEPFERENNSTASGVSGSGLGLAITKSLVEMMGGSISVISEIGQGSDFIVRLYFEVPSLSEIKDESGKTNYSFEGKRILIVEDNEENREIVCEILNDAGFEIDSARDGSFAIEKIQNSPADYYCAVLMDIQMPGINGYETTKIIRSFNKPGIDKLPIIALSANVYEEDRRKALEYGMNGYIAKPFNVNEMLKLLDYILTDSAER